MSIEQRHTTEQPLVISLKDGRFLSFPRRNWYRVTQDIAQALGETTAVVRPQLHNIRKNDPSIEVTTVGKLFASGRERELLNPEGERLQTIICDQANLRKLIQAYPLVKKDGRPSKSPSEARKPILFSEDPESQELEDETDRIDQEDAGSNEFPQRTMRDKTPKQQIRKDLSVALTDLVLSHFLTDSMEDLNKNLRAFLQNLLPEYRHDRTPLDSIIKEPLGEFFAYSLIERLQALWTIEDIKPTDSVLQQRTIEYCLTIKQKGYDIQDIVDNACSHFSIPNPFTSSAESQSPEAPARSE